MIKWNKINAPNFLKYDLYFSQSESLQNKSLIFSSNDIERLHFWDTNINLQLHEKKFYILEAITQDSTYSSNQISAHNWHVNTIFLWLI